MHCSEKAAFFSVCSHLSDGMSHLSEQMSVNGQFLHAVIWCEHIGNEKNASKALALMHLLEKTCVPLGYPVTYHYVQKARSLVAFLHCKYYKYNIIAGCMWAIELVSDSEKRAIYLTCFFFKSFLLPNDCPSTIIRPLVFDFLGRRHVNHR